MGTPRTVLFLAFDGLQILDLTGPHEVFALAGRALGEPAYSLSVVGPAGGTIRTSSGLGLAVQPLPDAAEPVDTIVIPGGDGARTMPAHSPLVDWIRAAAPSARRIASVCSGAFLAGRAGLLGDRLVTTHWSRGSELQAEFPAARVDVDPIYVRDGALFSSAGITAGIDLALALVQDDLGVEVAARVARQLVMFLHRPGGQSQFATPTWAPRGRTEPVRAAQDLIAAEPGRDHRIGVLAAEVGMSERNFSRMFRREVGVSPARYVQDIRIAAARTLLQERDGTVLSIARRSGFGTAETMRRAFVRELGVAPDDYRSRFGAAR